VPRRAHPSLGPSTAAVAPPIPVLAALVLSPATAISAEDESADIDLTATAFDQVGSPKAVPALTPHSTDTDVATVSVDGATVSVHVVAPGSAEVYVSNGAVNSNHVAVTVTQPAGLIPYRREVLGFEFVPQRDDAGLVASSGQPFTKVGTPTLIGAGVQGYEFAGTDSIVFDSDDINPLLNADPSGFTLFIVQPTPAASMGVPRGLIPHASILALTDQSDYPLAIYAQDNTGAEAAMYGVVAYDESNYELTDDLGHPTLLAAGASRVYALRFTRADDPGPESWEFDDVARGRLDPFVDGVEYPSDGFGPSEPEDAGVAAGTIEELGSGAMYIGDDDAGSAVYPRIGSVLIYTEALGNSDIVAISAWLTANRPVPIS